MKRRIFGLENEYGLTCTLNGQRRLSPDNVARYLFEKVIPGARNANVFLENGARLYLDTGFHPEYATPECDDVIELVIHDKAGERIVEDLLHQAEKRLQEDGIEGNILLFKNNTDSAGNSYGCHENYLVSRDVSFQRLADPRPRLLWLHPSPLSYFRLTASGYARASTRDTLLHCGRCPTTPPRARSSWQCSAFSRRTRRPTSVIARSPTPRRAPSPRPAKSTGRRAPSGRFSTKPRSARPRPVRRSSC